MSADEHPLVLNDAVSQHDRARQAPAPDKVRVDGRDLPELLRFGAAYGRLIQFYDLEDQPDGDWSAFFIADPSVRLAQEAIPDLGAIEAEVEADLDALRIAEGFDGRLLAARRAIALIARLLRELTGQAPELEDIEELLTGVIGSRRHPAVHPPARRLLLHLRSIPLEEGVRRDARGVVETWFQQFAGLLEELAAVVLAALRQQRDDAAAALAPSLKARGHPPQGALWDAFCVLYGHARRTLNQFPQRLIGFYQDAILRQDSRTVGPDQVHLSLAPAGDDPVRLPPGTTIPAGSDAGGTPIGYAIEQAVTVTACTVSALDTLLVVSGKLLADSLTMVPQQVVSGRVTLADQKPAIAAPFPLFGASPPGPYGSLTTELASLGFAIASQTLMLTGGTRGISLGLTLAPASVPGLLESLAPIADAAGGIDAFALLAQILQAGLALSYSSTDGWVAVETFTVTPPDAGAAAVFKLGFTLSPDAKPFVAFTTPPAGTVPTADQPTLRAALVQTPVSVGPIPVPVYPYTLLSGLSLASVTIGGTVTGLATLDVSNPAGPVNPSQPFAVFGSPPVQQATLDVSAAELWVKPVATLTLTIGWFGLPVTSTGFYGYYYAYVVNVNGKDVLPGSQFDNTSFQVTLDVTDGGLWTIPAPTTQAPPLYLFRTGDGVSPPEPDQPVAPVTRWALTAQASVPADYYDASNSALRLTLSNPAYAFGEMLYAPSVMAASVRLTAAASACAQQCGQIGSQNKPNGHLAPVLEALGTAPDSRLDDALKGAVRTTLSGLNGAALTLVRDAIGASGAAEATAKQWLSDLSAALARPAPQTLSGARPQAALHQHPSGTVLANLQGWIGSVGASLGAHVQGLLTDARQILEAGESLATAYAQAAKQPPAVARPTMAAATRDAQTKLAAHGAEGTGASPAAGGTPAPGPTNTVPACIAACMAGANAIGFPNQPFVPAAASITLDYTAASMIPSSGAAMPDRFYHLLPFDGCEAVAWTAGTVVPLLVPVSQSGALLVTLSKPPSDLSLLFHLVEPDAGWPAKTPELSWEQESGSGWTRLEPLRDSTGNLAHSGLVRLKLTLESDAAESDAAQSGVPMAKLRIGVTRDADVFPLLAALAPNAVHATWVGPGGADARDTPLPARTIVSGGPSLPQIGSVEQPMASFGGRPTTPDAPFEMWLAERLRHKTFGVQAWDYAQLVLDAYPLLWQVAVVPASDGGCMPAPGRVWIIPVPGSKTPSIANPTQPVSDGATLAAIEAMLRGRISPFIDLRVSNPPYLAMKVTANLVFTRADAVGACEARLNTELIAFLSPWPPSGLGPRPADYYTKWAVAQFIRRRPYVRGILSFDFAPDPPGEVVGWRYITSAAAHTITGKAAPA